jgi:hypothetical protein
LVGGPEFGNISLRDSVGSNERVKDTSYNDNPGAAQVEECSLGSVHGDFDFFFVVGSLDQLALLLIRVNLLSLFCVLDDSLLLEGRLLVLWVEGAVRLVISNDQSLTLVAGL